MFRIFPEDSKIIFFGNLGSGKSTLLNALIQEKVFKSGISAGTGLTDKMSKYIKNNITFVDTPALAADPINGKQSAQEINQALKLGGNTFIVFIIRLSSGRVSAEDKAMIDLILNSIPNIGDKFSIIVNFSRNSCLDELKTLNHKITNIYFFPYITEAYEKNNFLIHNTEHLTNIANFISEVGYIDINPNNIIELNYESYDEYRIRSEAEINELLKRLKYLEDLKNKHRESERNFLHNIYEFLQSLY